MKPTLVLNKPSLGDGGPELLKYKPSADGGPGLRYKPVDDL